MKITTKYWENGRAVNASYTIEGEIPIKLTISCPEFLQAIQILQELLKETREFKTKVADKPL